LGQVLRFARDSFVSERMKQDLTPRHYLSAIVPGLGREHIERLLQESQLKSIERFTNYKSQEALKAKKKNGDVNFGRIFRTRQLAEWRLAITYSRLSISGSHAIPSCTAFAASIYPGNLDPTPYGACNTEYQQADGHGLAIEQWVKRFAVGGGYHCVRAESQRDRARCRQKVDPAEFVFKGAVRISIVTLHCCFRPAL
jgi:hypothetical protein